MSPATAWSFTGRLSPRAAVRCQDVDGKYGVTTTVHAPAPVTAWAVHLTDSDHWFRLLGFDFDAHEEGSPLSAEQLRARALHDTTAFVRVLDELGIAHVVCESGPSGGRHVWVALRDRLDGQLVADVAVAAGRWLPSLDITPLSNVSTGALRPPGSPHRAGGASTVLAGDVEGLCAPTVRRGHVEALLHRLVELAPPPPPPPDGRRVLPIEDGDDGHPKIPGTWRDMSRRGWQLAREPIGGDVDASARLFAVLLAAARAHWTLRDVQAQLGNLPGLEHARTVRVPGAGHRRPRPRRGAASPARVLARNWAAAVAHLADNARTEHTLTLDDPDFDARAGEMAAAIAHLDRKADMCMGRWARPGGAKDRLVLDVLMGLALTTLRFDVGASVRDLAVRTGICHTSAWRSLIDLEADGWIRMAVYTEGTKATVWQVLPWGLTEHGDPATAEDHPPAAVDPRSPQGDVTLGATGPDQPSPLSEKPAPAATAGADERSALLTRMSHRRELARHDAFTHTATRGAGRGLTTLDAFLYSRLPRSPLPLERVFPASLPTDIRDGAVARLQAAGLVTIDAHGNVARTLAEARDSFAAFAGTAGTLTDRAATYELERDLWVWWVAESMWTTVGGRDERRRHRRGASARRRPGQHTLAIGQPGWADREPYPRRPGGRRDHRAARAALARRTTLRSP